MYATIEDWSYWSEDETKNTYEATRDETKAKHPGLDLLLISTHPMAGHLVVITANSIEAMIAWHSFKDNDGDYLPPTASWCEFPDTVTEGLIKFVMAAPGTPVNQPHNPEIFIWENDVWKRAAEVLIYPTTRSS